MNLIEWYKEPKFAIGEEVYIRDTGRGQNIVRSSIVRAYECVVGEEKDGILKAVVKRYDLDTYCFCGPVNDGSWEEQRIYKDKDEAERDAKFVEVCKLSDEEWEYVGSKVGRNT